MKLLLSGGESEKLGLRIARSERCNNLQSDELIKEIVSLELDVARVKIDAFQQNIFDQMQSLGFPYFINSILYRNKIDYNEKANQSLPDGFRYETFDGSKKEIFINLVEDVYYNGGGVNYSNKLYQTLINPQKEKDAVRSYFLDFDSSKQSSKVAWMLKKDNDYVGFVCGEFTGDEFEGLWYGMLPKFRKKGISHLLITIIHNECLARGTKYFFNDVQFQNIPSQINVMKQGVMPNESYLNFTLMPLLSLAKTVGSELKNDRALPINGLAGKIIGASTAHQTALINIQKGKPGELTIPTHYTELQLGPENNYTIYHFFKHSSYLGQLLLTR